MSRARCCVRQQVAIFNCERQVMDVPVPGACKALKIPSPPRRCSGDDRLGNGDFDGRVQARRPAGRLALDSAVAIRSPRGSISVSNTRSAGAGQPVTDAIFPNARIGTLLRLAWINVAAGADPGVDRLSGALSATGSNAALRVSSDDRRRSLRDLFFSAITTVLTGTPLGLCSRRLCWF